MHQQQQMFKRVTKDKAMHDSENNIKSDLLHAHNNTTMHIPLTNDSQKI